ncbi:bifunctional PTS fructose transporter subunit IIA/HPr protein [Pasteurellaceae bacterium Pebbles2]|nr:bifunctional PTS fructose transporter subunit IIA/HPr protein [Pasteurellaceae bacterium Pebbles2]
MFNLPERNIHLAMSAENKTQAIEMAAKALTQAGYVAENYVQGMLAREQQTSTFLGNGIAIPHGTLDTRQLVNETGVVVLQFPQGVDWGEDNTAYIVIGIAARSDEHLALLRQLTHILSDEAKAQKLATLTDVSTFRALLLGEAETFQVGENSINLDVETDNLLTLIALNAGQLQQKSAVNNRFVSEVIGSAALPLGNGLWITDAVEGNLENGVVFSRAKDAFEINHKLVQGVLTVAVKDEAMNPILTRLLDPAVQQHLLKGNKTQIACALNGEPERGATTTLLGNAVIGTFTVRNEHGLHARPSSVLVSTLKPFSAKISVQNLNRANEFVNAKSAMKVVALGASKGQRLRFVAEGEDALEAIQTLGKAFADGFGEQLAPMLLAEPDQIEMQSQGDVANSAVQNSAENEAGLADDPNSLEAVFTVINEHGLHARPSKMLVSEVKKYNASIAVQNLDRETTLVSAKSLMKIVALGAVKGHRLRFVATGEQAQEALDGIGAAMKAGLGE